MDSSVAEFRTNASNITRFWKFAAPSAFQLMAITNVPLITNPLRRQTEPRAYAQETL